VRLWRRAWRVQVGSLLVSSSDPSAGAALDVKFKIKRTLASMRAGTCELEIYNLTSDHRRELAHSPRRTTYVAVDAGYLEGQSRIFTGDLRKAVVERSGPDWIVKVTAGDGEHAIRSARVSRSFAPGTTLETVVRAVADAMGVGVGNAVTALRGASFGAGGDALFPEGTLVYGSAAAELTRLCDSARLSWSIQEGALQILPLGGALTRSAIRLSPDTGLVEAPSYINRRSITVQALLQPGLVPGAQLVVDSGVVADNRIVSGGTWRVFEAEYAGDTRGAEWTATLTCHRPLGPLVGADVATTPNLE